jgi:hypothetical protein
VSLHATKNKFRAVISYLVVIRRKPEEESGSSVANANKGVGYVTEGYYSI